MSDISNITSTYEQLLSDRDFIYSLDWSLAQVERALDSEIAQDPVIHNILSDLAIDVFLQSQVVINPFSLP